MEIAKAYLHACLMELEAIKPGNVHIFADGHGMQVSDFITSAEVSSQMIADPNWTLGERVFHSVNATWQAVGCNTNLGIILLCAPIIHAYLQGGTDHFPQHLNHVISSSTQSDAAWVFKAIRLASPAGLGEVDVYDVAQPVSCTLLEAMQVAASRDLIAQQYAEYFTLIRNDALPFYRAKLSEWQRPAWATTMLYLYFLAHYPDSHITRKFGQEQACIVQQQAHTHFSAMRVLDNPKLYLPDLLTFDHALKARGVNPGTSADLTVATLLLHDCMLEA